MTNHGRLIALIAGALLGAACVDATDDGVAYLTSEQCDGATPWAAWTTYATGAVVSFDGAVYQCVQGHTSQPDWTPSAVPALWMPGSCECGGGGGGGGGSGGGGGDDGGGGGAAAADALLRTAVDDAVTALAAA
ncbi:MAG: hypothetical protein KC464_01090, partial [Myxococcales bacterium]|nr:hypothetical protein [Myxococcales bacterium]